MATVGAVMTGEVGAVGMAADAGCPTEAGVRAPTSFLYTLAPEPGPSLTKTVLVVLVKTLLLLKLVVEPMLPISVRMFWYSWLAELTWLELSVPFEASVASVTARLSRLVTWESAPSAVCSRPTPLAAFWADWV